MATTVTLKPNAIDISGSTSGTTTLQATAVAGTTTLTLPAATDTLVGKATTDTLTNKTLTTPSVSSPTISDGTANGVAYLNGSKVLTTGSALVFDGTNLGVGVTPSAWGSGITAIQLAKDTSVSSHTTGGNLFVNSNTYYNGSNWVYSATRGASQYQQNDAQHIWYQAASGTAGTAISFTQAMSINGNGGLQVRNTIGVGNTTASTSGAGITFPATQSASSDANTLDDYEEGTWTPNSTGIAVVGTFSSSGIYTKVGRVVTVIATFSATTSVAVAAGASFSTNIPIASGNLGIDSPGTFFRFGQSGGEIIVAQNDTRFYAGQAIGAVANFQISATYFV